MKNLIAMASLLFLSFATSGCSGYLDQESDTILTNEQVYSDPALIKSTLSNFYGRISWGQNITVNFSDFRLLDEAVGYDMDYMNGFDRNLWRVYDYALVRNLNQFLQGLKETTALSEEEKKPLRGEARFIRAWYYFCVARCLGGMPIIGDDIYDYTPGMDITTIQVPRATESEMYDYVISECREASEELGEEVTAHSARANKWTAKMLEARAALYAASLAKYNADYPSLKTDEGSVGIDAGKAGDYYRKALEAASYVIEKGPYVLQDRNADKARNFYEAVTVKDGNTEVIWARDYITPEQKHALTENCIPVVLRKEGMSASLSVLLNLVQEFEPIDTDTPGQGREFETGTPESPKFYDTAGEMFKKRDPRLGGTVIYSGETFAGTPIVLQAGQLIKENGQWTKKYTSYHDMGNRDENGILITSPDGPLQTGDRLINKTGFTLRKFLDENPAATTNVGSDVWSPYFRISEAYLIACEAAFELGDKPGAIQYINKVRTRAGVKPLTAITFENIVHERCVEFAFEGHRFWDLKRWRLADKIWNKNAGTAKRYGLYPYLVVAPGDPEDGKWAFEKVDMSFLYPNPLNFETQQYYGSIDDDWRNRNPKLEKNPYQ